MNCRTFLAVQLLLSVAVSAVCHGQTYPFLTWAKSIEGPMSPSAIKVDLSGKIYMTGNFDGTVDFDPGPGVQSFTSSGIDTYVSAWDNLGNLLWVKVIQGGAQGVISSSLALDNQGNIFIGGYFYDSPDFDPGTGVSVVTAVGDGDAFILKLANDGDFIWAKSLGGPDLDEITSVAVDPSGNVAYTGHFSGDVDFDPGTGSFNLTSPATADYTIFITKLDGNGNFAWAKMAGDGGLDQGRSIAIDATGAVYVTGDFDGSGDFDTDIPSVLTFTSDGDLDLFLIKLNASGGFVFAKHMGGSGYFGSGYAVIIDGTDNILLTGTFEDTMDFDPGPSTFLLTAAGSTDAFICKLDNTGSLVWAKAMGGTDYEEAYSVTSDVNSNYTIMGYYYLTADFDPGSGVFELTPLGETDTFICQLDKDGNFNWASSIGGPLYDPPGILTTDAIGNLYATGQFQGICDVDPQPSTVNLGAAGVVTNYVLKLADALAPTDITIYNAVSPNSDGKNDLLFIENISAATTNQNKLAIFNRWGDVVFNVDNYDNQTRAFRGLNNSGTELPTGTYFYRIDFTSGTPSITGFISLRK